MSDQEIINIIQMKLSTLNAFHIVRLALFGSHVTGTAKPESDLDILVDFEDGQETLDNYMDLKFALEDMFHRKVDLVITNTIKPALRDSILRSARYVKGA